MEYQSLSAATSHHHPHTLSIPLSGAGAGNSETVDLVLSLFHHRHLLSMLLAVVLEHHSVRLY